MPLPSTILYPASGGGGGGAGTVVGPGSSTTGNLASFGDTSGDLLADSGIAATSAIIGSTGATDNAILRANETGGVTLQNSDLSIEDASGGEVVINSAGGNDVVFTKSGYAHSGAVSAQDFFGYEAGTTKRLKVSGNYGSFIQFSSGGSLQWNSAGDLTSGSSDTGLARSAAGVVKVTGGSTGIRGFMGGGAAVASAAAMPVPTGRVFHVTGTTNITSITSTNFQSGAVITLIFDDVLTFTDGNNLKLAGDFVTTADDTITLAYDGTNWYEVARSIN